MNEKIYTVYTYYYPPDEGHKGFYLAYTRYGGHSPALRIYEVRAASGTEAKKKAIKLRKEAQGK